MLIGGPKLGTLTVVGPVDQAADPSDRVIFGAHTAYNCPGIKEKVTRLAFESLLEELQCPMPS